MQFLAAVITWSLNFLILGAIFYGVWYWGESTGYQEGYSTAIKSAYKTNPPSEQLEMTCAGLWVGEQNKKAWRKENAGNAK